MKFYYLLEKYDPELVREEGTGLYLFKSLDTIKNFNPNLNEIKEINVSSPLLDFTQISHVKRLIHQILPKGMKLSTKDYKTVMHNLDYRNWSIQSFPMEIMYFLASKLVDSEKITIDVEAKALKIIRSYSLLGYRSPDRTKMYVLKHTN